MNVKLFLLVICAGASIVVSFWVYVSSPLEELSDDIQAYHKQCLLPE